MKGSLKSDLVYYIMKNRLGMLMKFYFWLTWLS